MSYTKKNLTEVQDAAARMGFSEHQESRFAGKELDAETLGLAYYVVKPGMRQAFGHSHENAEEVYVVVGGRGRMKLDDELVDVGPLDAIRVAPQVARSFEAGDGALQVVAFGPRHEGDAELLMDFWKE